MDDRLLTAEELSAKIGIGKSSLYRMAIRGLVPSVLVGAKLGGRRFSEQAVRAALSQLQRPPRPYHTPKERAEAKLLPTL